ncbi:NADH-ubiquinone oxidoreductase chain 5 [Dissostichus eleginoides]|uniref:NADH-ubiquinone oxidoreductase chain 5 n=1 Tax=Dissostichus eleginoides TaxID=100907 RepID=A0AAD9CHH1_DISEL|nr:NADH-ubiquinone oxidoreductase chain 5 [Dissostichus eleginoides]
MADADAADGDQDPEAPVEELDGEHEALLHFGKYSEAQHSIPWEQKTFRQKANFHMDRIFLGFLVIFFLVFLGEFGYKMWYVTNVKAIAEFVSDCLVFLFNWLFTQTRQEELFEL